MARGSNAKSNSVEVVQRRSAVSDPELLSEFLNSEAGLTALMSLKRGLIIDMDDTLISNERHFVDARQALQAIYKTLDRQDRSEEVLAELHSEIDTGMISELGYTPERWSASAQKCAQVIAGRDLTSAEVETVEAAAQLAMNTGELLPGVEKTLEACQKAGVPMLLKTKGCKDKQEEKLWAHKFDRFFGNKIWIVDRKNPESFTRAAQHFGLPSPVSIGDSENSDITPALSAGLEAILIDHGDHAWNFEQTTEQHSSPRVASFPEAITTLLTSESLASA